MRSNSIVRGNLVTALVLAIFASLGASTLVYLISLAPVVQGAHLDPAVVATIPVGNAPGFLAVDPGSNRIYVSNSGSASVSVIDGAAHSVVATISVTGASVANLAADPGNHRVYVTRPVPSGAAKVSVIDGAPGSSTVNTIIAEVTLPGNPSDPPQIGSGIAVDPATHLVYVTKNDPGGGVFVIDGSPINPASIAFTDEIPVAANPRPVAVDPATSQVFVGHGSFFGRSQITKIDGPTNAVSDCTTVGVEHTAMAVNPQTGRVYVARAGAADSVAVFDGTTCSAVIANIPVGDQPVGIAVNPAENRVYVTSQSEHRVLVIDIAPGSPTENTVVDSVPLVPGSNPQGVEANPINGQAYVANTGLDTVSVIAGVIHEVDLAISKTGFPSTVAPGEDLTYTLTVSNPSTGAGVATGIIVTDSLPSSVTFKSATASQGATNPVTGAEVLWNLESLVGGQIETLEIVVNVDPGTPDGTVLSNVATIEGDQGDPNPSNNTATVTTNVAASDVVLVNVAGPELVQAGTAVVYQIQAADVTDLAAAQVTFTYDPALWTLGLVDHGPGYVGCLNAVNEEPQGTVELALVCPDGHAGAPLTLWTVGLDAAGVPGPVATSLAVTGVTLGKTNEDEIPATGGSLDVTITPIVCGDLHPAGGGDGDVDVLDALRSLRIAVGLVVPTPNEKIAGDPHPDNDPDPDGDGDNDVLDALRILKHSVGLVEITSCGGP